MSRKDRRAAHGTVKGAPWVAVLMQWLLALTVCAALVRLAPAHSAVATARHLLVADFSLSQSASDTRQTREGRS
jgi:hypothetical protein